MNLARLNFRIRSVLALSLLMSTSFLLTPAQAGLINEPDPALGAKVNENVKTGVRYWIELKRHGKISHVTNQERFATGDQIRFHVQATVDGYAYIVLRSGSQGEQAVLFPLEKSMDNNKLNRETDYALPSDDYLTFDSHPGTEKVTLLFSKRALDPTKVMATTFKDSNHVVLRASTPGVTGSKDLIPARTTVTYQSEEALLKDDSKLANDAVNGAKPDQGMINSVIAMSTTPTTFNPAAHTDSAGGNNETLDKANAALKKVDATLTAKADSVANGDDVSTIQQIATKVESNPDKVGAEASKIDKVATAPLIKSSTIDVAKNAARSGSKSSNREAEEMTTASLHKITSGVSVKSSSGAVIVRQDDPEKVLHIDVDLEHTGT